MRPFADHATIGGVRLLAAEKARRPWAEVSSRIQYARCVPSQAEDILHAVSIEAVLSVIGSCSPASDLVQTPPVRHASTQQTHFDQIVRVQRHRPIGLHEVDRRGKGGIGNPRIVPTLRRPAMQVDADYIGMAGVLRHLIRPNARSVADVEDLQAVSSRAEVCMVEFAG